MHTSKYNPVGRIALLARRRRQPQSASQKADQAERQLTAAIGDAQEVLFRATTVFPFVLFPDTISVDRSKLSVTHRTFFKVGEVISIRIEDILNVTAQVGPFFGSVKVTTRFFAEKEAFHVNYLWRQDALRLERVIQGYIIALKKKIDLSALSARELANKLDELGKSAANQNV